jgi:hypothetical protein
LPFSTHDHVPMANRFPQYGFNVPQGHSFRGQEKKVTATRPGHDRSRSAGVHRRDFILPSMPRLCRLGHLVIASPIRGIKVPCVRHPLLPQPRC